MSTKKHTIYVIRSADNGNNYWNRAGVAFENKDGSFTFTTSFLRRSSSFARKSQSEGSKLPPSNGRPRQPGRPALVATLSDDPLFSYDRRHGPL